jgi:hypothetical protein
MDSIVPVVSGFRAHASPDNSSGLRILRRL